MTIFSRTRKNTLDSVAREFVYYGVLQNVDELLADYLPY